MGFNKLQPLTGPFSLAPGQQTRVWVWFGSGGPGQEMGDDRGAQWIMADPADVNDNAPINAPGLLTVSDFTKVRDFWSGYDPDNNEYIIDFTRTVVRYEVTVTNTGNDVVFFTVQGGGNT
jgi:hypothetical protein